MQEIWETFGWILPWSYSRKAPVALCVHEGSVFIFVLLLKQFRFILTLIFICILILVIDLCSTS